MKPCKLCGQPMASDAPEGLCARCLLSAAVKESSHGAPRVDPHPAPAPEEIAPHFPELEILALLGRGGMGVVYKARQPQLDRLVALKILRPESAGDPQFAERFTREARALARLSHPNIVAVHEFGQRDGMFYFLMEFVDGANLRQLIESHAIKPAEALAIVPKICEALQFAHEEGVMHRDIKPENILIDKKGRVKIADFGLAKILGIEAKDFTLTQTGMSLGTPRYMAPEQVEHPESVDHRADIYSLGVVFYEMLTGELPMGRFAPPSEKVQVDVRLDDVVLRSLEKDVARRYQHASEIKSDMDAIASSAAALSSRPAPATAPVATAPRLSRLALIGAIWTALGVVATIVWVLWNHFYAAPPTPATDVLVAQVREIVYYTPKWPVFLLALTAPFGATILGAIAIAQIKRSGGKLYGLRLAAADAIFFPLLVVGALAFYLTNLVAFTVAFNLRTPPVPVPGAAPEREPFAVIDFAVLDSLGALTVMFFAGRAAWRSIAGVKREAGLKDKNAPTAEAKPRRRHLLNTLLTVLFLGALIFGINFRAHTEMTPTGRTSITTVGSFEPLFVYESGPSGFHFGFQIFSWSFFALIVALVAFGALWRVCREDEGKVARDPAWWRDWWKQVGIWCGLLFLACMIRTVRDPQAVLQPMDTRIVSAQYRATADTSEASGPAAVSPLRERLNAALVIVGGDAREGAFVQIALDAAEGRDLAIAREALDAISTVSVKDRTTETCSMALARHGELAGARQLAELIRSSETRDRTLRALAAGPVVEKP